MDEQKRQTDLSDDLRTKMRSICRDGRSPLNDFSTAPPDARAYLADHQIHRHHIDAMCVEAMENWPDIQSIECGAHEGKHPYIALRIHPYDDRNAKRHNAFIGCLRDRFPEYSTVTFYCLGEDHPYSVSDATPIYKRRA